MKRWIINIICFLIGFSIPILTRKEPEKIPEVDNHTRDSIYIINDSIIEKIKYVYKVYEKEVSNIISSNDSVNLSIFSEYIDNYQRTIKDN